jgi:arginine N-succinyltransferase
VKFEIRSATPVDQEDLVALAEHLDSVNLPHDPAEIAEILAKSEQSFTGKIVDPKRRQYVFVLRDLEARRAVGTSMIIGQLGSRDAPYIFFDVRKEERYSVTLDKHFEHQVLSIGYSFHGPTEIGGLVVHPDYRRDPERLGLLISYVRFLFIAIHRDLFQNRVLAELMPPLEPDGTSHLWEAVGRRFTGLTYREADRLSKKNKEFIRGLFPNGDIYASVLPNDAQAVIGQVGRETRGVAKMLGRIGFRYWDRVDPFDGGPHFIAPTDEVELVQRSRRAKVRTQPIGSPTRALVAVEGTSPHFRAFALTVHLHADHPEEIALTREQATLLGVDEGGFVAVLPLD